MDPSEAHGEAAKPEPKPMSALAGGMELHDRGPKVSGWLVFCGVGACSFFVVLKGNEGDNHVLCVCPNPIKRRRAQIWVPSGKQCI